MPKKNFFSKATDPQQYDLGHIYWEKEGANSPIRLFFAEYLEKYLGNLSGKRVIDIGSGSGSYSVVYEKLGAERYLGIEPSEKNVAISRRLYPKMEVVQGTLESFNSSEVYDVAVSVMVFEHIAAPELAFRKVSSLLGAGGLFYLICYDKDWGNSERFDYVLEREELEHGELAIATTSSLGTLYDVLRPLGNYIRYAKSVGLELKEHIPMPPTPALLTGAPQYETAKDRSMTHLLIFAKTETGAEPGGERLRP